jgi:uncharacterized protein YcbK (DUF882 family)
MSLTELLIPGKKNPVKLRQLIDGCSHFYWYEALHNFERVPSDYTVTANIIKLAKTLEPVRDFAGCPIVIQSWYRDPVSNRLAGGVSNSNHLYGEACDWHPLDNRIERMHEYLDSQWKGGLGFYGDWFHTDIGSFARWYG